MRTALSIMIGLLLAIGAYAQPEIEWVKTYGEGIALKAARTNDGKVYIVGGVPYKYGDRWSPPVGLMVNVDGSLEFSQLYYAFGMYEIASITPTIYGGFILALNNRTRIWRRDSTGYFLDLVKVDKSGGYFDTYDSRLLRQGENMRAGQFARFSTLGYLVAGTRKHDIHIEWLSLNGAIEKVKDFGSDGQDFCTDFILLDDQTLVLAGYAYYLPKALTTTQKYDLLKQGKEFDKNEVIQGKCDLFFAKINPQGELTIWLVYPDSWVETPDVKIVQVADRGYIMAANCREFFGGEWTTTVKLVKLNSEGLLEWSKSYGSRNAIWLKDFIKVDDKSVAYLGWTDNKSIVERIDMQGNVIWSLTIDEFYENRFNTILQLYDKSYILGGSIRQALMIDEICLIKTTPDTMLTPTE